MEVIYISTSKEFSTRKDLVQYLLTSKVASYNDKNCKDKQCEAGRYRSVTDIHKIVLSRFPKTSFKAMLRIIAELIDENMDIAMIWCTQVNKVVVRYITNSERKYITSYSKDRYYESAGVDGYSLKDYATIINDIKKESKK